MLERLATWFLNTYVAEYVGNINTDQLSIGILRGAVELEKLPLKKDALKKLNLPIEVKSGFIGKLKIEIPFRRLKSQPWVVQVDQLYLVAGPSAVSPYDEDAEHKKVVATKKRKLDAMEEQWREEQRTKSSGWFWSSFTSSFASSIVENLQIIMNNIHIRYEDSTTLPGHSFAVGMTMDSLSTQSTDDQWVPKFMSAAEKARKLMDLTNFAVYWDTQLLGELDGTDLVDALIMAKSLAQASMDPMTCSTSVTAEMSSRFIIKPATVQARFTRNCSSHPLRLSEGPRFQLSIDVGRVAVVVLEEQYDILHRMVNHLRLYSKGLQYRKWRPVAKDGNRLTARQLWLFAITAVLSKMQEKNRCHSPSFVLKRAHQNVTYVRGYTQYLTQSTVTVEVKEQIAATENEQSFEELCLLRQLAMTEVKQQRELAEAAKSRAQEQLPAGGGRGWFQQWFPSWGEAGGGEKDKVNDITDQPGESTTSEEELEDELLDAIGYNPDSNSVFMRDRKLAILSFNLREGSLQLLGTSGDYCSLGPEPITELCFSELQFGIDYRPRMKYIKLDTSLHSVTMVDHLHPDSLFPTLVQPKGARSSGSVGSILWRQYSKLETSTNSEELLTASIIQEQHRNCPHIMIKVNTLPLDIVFNSDTVSRVKHFFMRQRQQELSSDWTEQLWLRLRELQTQTASEVRNQIEEMLLGEANKMKLTIDLDVAAPHLIIPEDFTNQNSSLVILDLGNFRFCNDNEQAESPMDSQLPLTDEDDDDDEFATPPSSPPSDEEGFTSAQFSQPAPPSELQSALQQSINQTQRTISDRYLLTLSEFQVLVGKVDVDWKMAIKTGHSSLHVMDKFTLSVSIERRSGFAIDTDISNLALSANLPSLSFHLDEQKVTALISCVNTLTSVLENPSPPPPTPSSDNSPPSHHTGDNLDSMGVSMYYSMAESTYHPKTEQHTSVPTPHEVTGSMKRLHRMPTFGSNSRMLVAAAQLLDARLSIDRVELTLNSRGKDIIQLVVPGVNLSFLKRPYDSTFNSVIQDVCVVDQLQSFGPDFELLICSGIKALYQDNSHTSPDQWDSSADRSAETSTPSAASALLSLCVSSFTPFSPKHPEYDKQVASADSCGRQIISAMCSGLDVLVNQETAAELLSFVQRTLPQHKSPEKSQQPDQHKMTPQQDATSSLPHQLVEGDVTTREVDAHFERLTVRLVRGVPITSPSSSFSLSSSSNTKHSTCHLIGEVSLMELVIKASFSNEMRITGQLSSVCMKDLTNIGQKYPLIFSSGLNSASATSTVNDGQNNKEPEVALSFTISQHFTGSCSEYHIDVLVAAMCYTHSTNFVSEVELFISDFRHYMEAVKNSLRSAAVGVAKGIVSDKSRIAEGLSKLSVSFGPTQSLRLQDEDDTDGGVAKQQGSYAADKSYIKVNVRSPVIVLPRSSTSNECLVAHLGEISFIKYEKSFSEAVENNDTLFSLYDCQSNVIDRLRVTVSNISLHSTKSADALSSVTRCRDVPNSRDSFKVLREVSVSLRIDWCQAEPDNGLHEEEIVAPDETDVFADEDDTMSYPELIISAAINEPVLMELPKDVFDQAKSTLKNILHSRKKHSEATDANNEGVAEPSPTPTSPRAKRVRFQSHVVTHTLPATAKPLPKISANFSLPKLTVELKETIEEKERNLVYISLDQFNVKMGQMEQYRTDFDLNLHSIIIEDLLQPKDSQYRYLFASSNKPLKPISPLATPISSLKIPSLFQPPSMMVKSLTNPLVCLSHYMSSPKPVRARMSPLRAFSPNVMEGDGDKTGNKHEDERTDTAESSILEEDNEESSNMANSLKDLVSIKAFYIDKNCPDFQTKYESISGHVDVEFSSVNVTVNLQTWVVLLDFFGIGIPTPPSSRSHSPPPPPEAANEQPHNSVYTSNSVFGREHQSSSFNLRNSQSGSSNMLGSVMIDQMLSHDMLSHELLGHSSGNTPSDSPMSSITGDPMNDSWLFRSSYQTLNDPNLPSRMQSSSSDVSSVWGCEDKPSFQVNLCVQSLSVTFNKPEHPFAKGIVSGVKASIKYQKGNINASGTLGQASVTDLTDTGACYRERLTTTGDQALQFSIFKYGKPDQEIVRPYDISVSAQIASIRYLHTMRFLKELLAFCMHFPQLIDAFQRMKAVAQGNLVYNGPDRKPRIQLDIKMAGAILLIPKHAFSSELACGNIDRITISNQFLFDGREGTFTYRKKQREAQHVQISKKQHHSSSHKSTKSVSFVNMTRPDGPSVTSNFTDSFVEPSSVGASGTFTVGDSIRSTGMSIKPNYIPAPVDSAVSSFSSVYGTGPVRRPFFSYSTRSKSYESMQSLMERDRLKMEQRLAAHSGPCLMDCIEVRLEDVDVFSAHKVGSGTSQSSIHRHNLFDDYKIVRDPGDVLKEKSSLTLLIERNLHEDMCREVPDISVDGCLSVTHIMLDKRQLELVKGLLDMNLGEDIEEFEKPSTLIHDPVLQPVVAEVWTGFYFRIDLVNVQLEFLQSREVPNQLGSVTQSLAKFDIQCSEFSFESRSNQTKTINLVSQAVIGYDARYEDCDESNKPNLFNEVLRPRCSSEGKPTSIQVEIHVNLSPKEIKASIILNQLRLIGIFDLLLSLKCFVFDKLPEEQENDDAEDEVDYNVSARSSLSKSPTPSLRSTHTTSTRTSSAAVKKPPRAVMLKLNVAETDLVVVEDTSSLNSNAVILKGTLVMVFKLSEARVPTVSTSIEKLELFSCNLRNEEETALSILDPVTVSIDLQPPGYSSHSSKSRAPPTKPNQASTTAKLPTGQIVDVSIPDLNFRLSYRDLKLFIAIAQSLPFFQTSVADHDDMLTSDKKIYVDNTLIQKLLPLGFTRAAIRKELVATDGDLNEAANNLLGQLPDVQAQGVLASMKKEERNFSIKSIEVQVNSLSLCLIDDCFNRDVPLLDFSLIDARIRHFLQGPFSGQMQAKLMGEYYNRNISAWEPVLEPWKFMVSWKKLENYHTNLDSNVRPDRILIRIDSPEQLYINVTSSLVHLIRCTQQDWRKDLFDSEPAQHPPSQDIVRSISNDADPSTSEAAKMTNIEKGLYLLYSVRVVGQRQRTPYYPFQLLNSTGLPLQFATISSSPSQVYVSSSSFLRHSQQVVRSNIRESEWKLVEPDHQVPFDCRSNSKMRHKDTRQLVVHQLVVKVAGWKRIAIPISVDKVGVFFRELEPSHDDELDTHVQVKGTKQTAQLVFAILLKDNCKIVNIRSGLVIHNKMKLPVEIQLKDEDGSSLVNTGQLPPNRYHAIPLHLIEWNVHIRPCGHKVQFSADELPWHKAPKYPTHHVISCEPISGNDDTKLFRFCANIKREGVERTLQDSNLFSSYIITLVPPFCVVNLLPCDLCLSLRRSQSVANNDDNVVKKGCDISFYEVDSVDKIEFTVELENFEKSEVCQVMKDRVGVVQAVKITDTKGCRLILTVTSELCGGAIKVFISCQYWLINNTGLPLIFKQDGASQEAAGQFEENELARNLQPLLFSYTEPELPEKCSMRIGKGVRNCDRPLWCHRFPMVSDTGVRRLFCKQLDGRPDLEYQIGVEVKRGRGQLRNTRVVRFVTRYQLENTTQYKIAYLQRHQLKEEVQLEACYKIPVAMPGAVVPFHWPRYDLDQLFCIRVKDINDCRWSGGFKLSQTNTFYINMRGAMNRSVFVRVEVILKGATFHVIFSDAANFPPPFRLENLSQVPVLFFQSKVNNPELYRTLKPSQSVPYSWDEPSLPHFLALQVQGATEAKEVSLMQFGQLGKLYYESYVYIAATTTFMKCNFGMSLTIGYQRDFPECPEYVLDVPQGSAVIFSKKDQNKRSQLWRRNAEGRLVHIASSEARGNDMVLDISRDTISSSQCEVLVVRKKSSSRNVTQTWHFRSEGRLVLSEDQGLCVQSRSPSTLKEGADVVLARSHTQPGGDEEHVPDNQQIGRLKHTPGSGILSLKCSSDGPTRVLTITDENKKYTHLSPRDDWVVVENGVTAPAKSSPVDQQLSHDESAEEDEDSTKIEVSLSLMLDNGVGISLINHVPEELLFASLTGVQVDFVYSSSSQQFNANVQHIQVDNQLPGSQTSTPLLMFPTPEPSGTADIGHPILHVVVERVPHKLPFVTVFRHFTVQLRKLTILLEEKLLFKLLQWLGVGSNPDTQVTTETDSVVVQLSQSLPQSLRSNQVEREFYFEEFTIASTEFRVSMHTTSQLPDDLQQIKYHLGFPLVKFEAPISLGGYSRHHIIGTADMYMEILVKHYKEVITNQALRIGLSVDFLGNPIGLFNDITSGVTGVFTTTPDVMGLVRDVTHGMSDTTSKLTGAVSDLLGQATFDTSYQEECEQVTESCQSSTDHLRAGLIGLSNGVFGGLTSIFTQPVRGARDDGLGGFIAGLGKGVVGTVAKPMAGVFSLASGATAAIRETTSKVSRVQPTPTRLRRCCVGPNGALPCYSLQQARGQEYLWRLNDGNFNELLVSYERLITEPDPMRAIISSDYLYFFQDSPPRPSHLHTKIALEELMECRLACSKSMPPNYYIILKTLNREKPHKFSCMSEPIAQRIVQLIQYAKNLYKERKNVLRTHRLHSHEIW